MLTQSMVEKTEQVDAQASMGHPPDSAAFSLRRKRCYKSSHEAASSDPAVPRLSWSRAWQSPRRCHASSPVALPFVPPDRQGQVSLELPLRGLPFAHSEPRIPVLGKKVAPVTLPRASTTHRVWRRWRPCPHGRRTALCQRAIIARHIPQAIPSWLAPRMEARGHFAIWALHPPPCRHPGSSTDWCHAVW